LNCYFPGNPIASVAAKVKASIEVDNPIEAAGADDAPTPADLVALIPSVTNSQERIVTRPDLLSRVYTMPSNFGKVYRVAVRSNPNNPLSTQLFIVSRNADNQLTISPDTLKNNLVSYLNPYRLVSDAIDILDAQIIDLQFNFSVVIDPSLNRTLVIQNAISKLKDYFNIGNFHIDQPIVVSELHNVLYLIPGIMSIDTNKMSFTNMVGLVNGLQYSNVSYDVVSNLRHGVLSPPAGGIFQVHYPDTDIIGTAST
jgi:hypothetical protein